VQVHSLEAGNCVECFRLGNMTSVTERREKGVSPLRRVFLLCCGLS